MLSRLWQYTRQLSMTDLKHTTCMYIDILFTWQLIPLKTLNNMEKVGFGGVGADHIYIYIYICICIYGTSQALGRQNSTTKLVVIVKRTKPQRYYICIYIYVWYVCVLERMVIFGGHSKFGWPWIAKISILEWLGCFPLLKSCGFNSYLLMVRYPAMFVEAVHLRFFKVAYLKWCGRFLAGPKLNENWMMGTSTRKPSVFL